MAGGSRRPRVAVALGAAVIALFAASGTSVAATPHVVTIPDPATNTTPSQSFIAACAGQPATPVAVQACEGVAVPEFNTARAKENLGPIVLPDNFASLSVPAQILAITDIERIDRGLPPVLGMSSYLNSLAQQGAAANDHPPFPNPFSPGRTEALVNWAQSSSSLLGAFMWMYWDGPGSGNLSCQNPGDAGCWGHRHTMLNNYASPIVMGAAQQGESMTLEIIGGDTADPVDVSPTWADISGALTYGVSPVNVTRVADVGTVKHATVTATSAGGSGQLQAGFQSGAPTWSVSPAACALPANGSCQFVLTFAPTTTGNFPGVLTVSDGQTVKTVALSGAGITPQVSLQVNTGSVPRGHRLKIHGLVTANPTNQALSHRDVALQTKRAGSAWHTIDTDTTGGRGKVTYRLNPTKTAKYRLEVIGAGGVVQAKSGRVKVRVTRR